MRVFILTIFFLNFFCLEWIQAQDKKVKVDPIMNVSWNTQEYDFGDMLNVKSENFSFKFLNLKDEPIFIDNVRTTCGCAAPDWTYDPILPGSEAEIKITYTPKSAGPFDKKIKVYLKDQRKPEILRIYGDVINVRD